MAMNFFEHQDQARKRSGLLVLFFIMAVVGIIIALYLLALGAFGYSQGHLKTGNWGEIPLEMHLTLVVVVGLFTLLIVGGGSAYKIMQLKGGGHVVAESLGGRPLNHSTRDPVERKVLNVVEEMAIASGTPVPPVFLLEKEGGINAFAAGYSPNDAVIGVTRGCAERLNRSELQGVIAHEFSHIFNGDMRLNIRLIGVLHGILIIGIIGYYVMRVMFYSGAGYRRSSSSDKKGGALPILAIALGLMAVGFIGTFFGSLIKSAVSRQREYLADASAVQFTRDPDGIAGALKKIGGYSRGSKVIHPNAPQASHMFFGEGVSLGLTSLFATHPPLHKRIKRVDPGWDGEYPQRVEHATYEPEPSQAERERRQAARAELLAGLAVAGAVGEAAPAGQAASRPSLLSQIGNPTEEHVEYARELIAAIPDPIKEAARETYGARAVVYGLLFNREEEARRRQVEQLAAHADQAVCQLTERLLPALEGLDRKMRLTLLDLAMPALRNLSPSQYRSFMENIEVLSRADRRIDLFEWSLQRILRKHLVSQFEGQAPRRVQYYSLARLREPCATLLTTLAYVGTKDPGEAQRAFAEAARALSLESLTIRGRDEVGLAELDRALDQLVMVAPKLKI
ncbi:MAG: M48 family metallopeptidase, partial [Phycisphaerales bacterium JB038]